MFPQSNLPPKSAPWGRRIESSILDTARGVAGLSELILGENRSLASQAAVQGRNLDAVQAGATRLQGAVSETASRSASEQVISDLTVDRTAPNANQYYLYSRTESLTFASPDGAERDGVIFISYEAHNSQSAENISVGTMFLSATLSGANRSLYSDQHLNPGAASVPLGWTEAGYLSGAIKASSLTVTIRATGSVSRYGGTSATVFSLGAKNVRVIMIWGGK